MTLNIVQPIVDESLLAARAKTFAEHICKAAPVIQRATVVLYGSYPMLGQVAPPRTTTNFHAVMHSILPPGYAAFRQTLDEADAVELDRLIGQNVFLMVRERLLVAKRC